MRKIVIKQLSKSYGQRHILDNVNLEINSSEGLIIIVGESGSGKSTFFNCLANFDTYSGEISFIDENKNQSISMLFQNFMLFDHLTVYENIMFGLEKFRLDYKHKEKIIISYLKTFGLQKLKNHKVLKLSGGEKQRVSLIRALVSDTSLLLCDEPTGSLDSKRSEEIFELLKEESKKRMVIIITHNMRLANKYGDIIYEIEDGKINLLKKNASDFIYQQRNYLPKRKPYFLSHYFKNKNIVSKFWMCFVLSLTYLSVMFISTMMETCSSELANQDLTYGDYNVLRADVSINQSDGFSIVKTDRVTESEIKLHIGNIKYQFYKSFETLFGGYSFFIDEMRNDEFLFLPIDDNEKDSFEMVTINTLANDLIDGRKLNFKLNKEISLKTDTRIITDQINLDVHFKITKVIDEFSFINSPVIYYSYQRAQELLKGITLNKIFLDKDKATVYDTLDLINCSTYDQTSLIFVESQDVKKIYFSLHNYQLSKSRTLTIQSRALTMQKSLDDILDAFLQLVLIFGILVIVCSVFVIYILINNNLRACQKEIGIIKSFSYDEKIIKRSFVLDIIILSALSLGVAFIFRDFFLSSIDKVAIEKMEIKLNLISHQNYSIYFIAFFTLLIYVLTNELVKRKLKKYSIINLLKEIK